MSKYIIGTDVLGADEVLTHSIPSVCGVVMGGPQPARGVLAGTIEVVASLFFPTPLRVVVGSIGAMRIGYGLYRSAKGTP